MRSGFVTWTLICFSLLGMFAIGVHNLETCHVIYSPLSSVLEIVPIVILNAWLCRCRRGEHGRSGYAEAPSSL
jgi:hypothetical protein